MNFIKTFLLSLILVIPFLSCNTQNKEEVKVFKCLDILFNKQKDYVYSLELLMRDERNIPITKNYFESMQFVDTYTTKKYLKLKEDSNNSINYKLLYDSVRTTIQHHFQMKEKYSLEFLKTLSEVYLIDKKINSKVDLAIEIITIRDYIMREIQLHTNGPKCYFGHGLYYELDSNYCSSDTIIVKIKNSSAAWENNYYTFYKKLGLISINTKTNLKTVYTNIDYDKTLLRIPIAKNALGNFKFLLGEKFIDPTGKMNETSRVIHPKHY